MNNSIFSEGIEYISAIRASKEVGYAGDYVGQLCRARKVSGKLIGKTWYVDINSLKNYKNGKKSEIAKDQRDAIVPRPISTATTIAPTLLKYEVDTRPYLPQLSKQKTEAAQVIKVRHKPFKKILVASLVIVLIVGLGSSLLEYAMPRMLSVMSGEEMSANAAAGENKLIRFAKLPFDFIHQEYLAAASLSDGAGNFFSGVANGFRNLRDFVFNKIFIASNPTVLDEEKKTVAPIIPKPEPTPIVETNVAVTNVPQPLNTTSLKNELKFELENYVRSQINSLKPSPVVIYSSAPTITNSALESFKRNEVVPITYNVVRNQSDSDSSRTSNMITNLTSDGVFTRATFSTICIGTDCRTSWPSGSGGGGSASYFGDLGDVATSSDATGDIYYLNSSGKITNLGIGADGEVLKLSGGLPSWDTDNGGSGTFPFIATSYGVSTSTTIGFLNGFLSTASSTINAPLHLSALSSGGLGVDANGLVYSGATTTAGTGLTYSANSLNVNTSQNIATLSNLTSNGFVKTSGSNGTLSIDISTYLSSYDAWTHPVAGKSATTSEIRISGGLLSTASTTIDANLIVTGNSTTTNATTTNFYSTTASSTNLFSSLLNIGGSALSVGSSGFVGIGTAAPTEALTIRSSSNSSSLIHFSSAFGGGFGGISFGSSLVDSSNYSLLGDGANTYLNAPSSGSIFFRSGNANSAVINSSGLITFATTTTSGISVLTIATTSTPHLSLSAGAGFSQWTLRNSSGSFYLATTTVAGTATSSVSALSIDQNGIVTFGNSNATCIALTGASALCDGDDATGGSTANSKFATSTALSDSIHFAGATKLGLGTTTPQWLLQLASSTGSQLTLSDSSSITNSHWSFRNAGGNFYLATSSASTFATTSTSALSILGSSGRIGIASSSPWGLLSVNPNALGTGVPEFVVGSSTATHLVVTGGGTVGINTSNPSSSYVLDVNGIVNSSTYFVGAGTYLSSNTLSINNNGGTTAIFNSGNAAGSGLYFEGGGAADSFVTIQSTGGVGTIDHIKFQVGNDGATEALRAVSSGSVGISTSTPYYNLTVASTTGSQLALSSGAGFAQWAFRNAGGDLFLATTTVAGTATTSTSALSIAGGGFGTTTVRGLNIVGQATSTSNVGYSITTGCYAIGTTCVGGSSFTNTLANGGTATTTFYNGGVVFASSTGSGLLSQSSLAANFFWDETNKKLGLGTSTPFAKLSVNSIAGEAAFTVGSSTATSLIVDKLGNVGIGTAVPSSSYKLDVNGAVNSTSAYYVGGATSLSSNTLALSNNAAATNIFNQSSGANSSLVVTGASGVDSFLSLKSTFGVGTADYINFLVGNAGATEAARIISSGNIGFGTTTPNTLTTNTIASSTAPQLALSSGAGFAQWTLRNAGGSFFLSTTTVAGTATTSISALEIAGSGFGTTTIRGLNISGMATSTSNVGYNITTGCYAIGNVCLSTSSSGGSANSKWATSSTDTLAIYPTNALRIGIGTTTPYYGFTVASSTGPQLALSDGLGVGQWTFRNAGGNFYLATTTVAGTATTSTSALSILGSSGRIGIASSSPWGLLSVNPNALGGGVPEFVVGSSTATHLVVTGFGNVGIKNAAPSEAYSLDVNGAVYSTEGYYQNNGASYFLYNQLVLNNNGSNVAIKNSGSLPGSSVYIQGGDAIDSHITLQSTGGVGTSDYINFKVGNDGATEAMRIVNSGSVGVATDTPWRKFSVTGTVGFDGLTANAGAGALCLSANKEVTYSAGATCTVSSQRFKHNINDLESSLDLINSMRPVSFVYNDDIGVAGEQLGFIAEEVEMLDPRLVVHDKDGLPYSVKYENMTAVLAKAIQELDLKIANSPGQSLVGGGGTSIFDSIISKLSDWGVSVSGALTRITNLFVGTIHVEDKLCVDDICVNKDQLKSLLIQAGGTTEQVVTTDDNSGGGDVEDQNATTTDSVITEPVEDTTGPVTSTTTESSVVEVDTNE